MSLIWSIFYSVIFSPSHNVTATQDHAAVVVVPYFHKISHCLKSVASQFGVRVVFSDFFRLDRLTPFSTQGLSSTKNHRCQFVSCASNVVYSIPFTCGFQYIRQSKRCINDRLREHFNNVKNDTKCSEISDHLRHCNCQPSWSESSVVLREPNLTKRLFLEAGIMASVGNAISCPSVSVSRALRAFVTR